MSNFSVGSFTPQPLALPKQAAPQAPPAQGQAPAPSAPGTGSQLPHVPEAGPRAGIQLGAAGGANETDEAFLTRVYREELGRTPDPEGFAAWMKNIEGGMTRDVLRQHFKTCPEAQLPETKARKAWHGSQAGAEGRDPVETIKHDPRYASAELDLTSLQTATESASKWVFEQYPDLVKALDQANNAVPENKQKARQLGFELTGHLIGVLRANGVDAQRLARHTHNDFGNPSRYVNDAFVLPDGRAIDWLGGEGVDRQFHDLDVPSPKTDRNFGVVPREPGDRLSSSTLGI